MLLDSPLVWAFFLLRLLLPFIATSYQTYSLPRSLFSLPHPCFIFSLCNAGIVESRSIWVSFIHAHLVRSPCSGCDWREFSSHSNGWMACAGGFDTAHAAARYVGFLRFDLYCFLFLTFARLVLPANSINFSSLSGRTIGRRSSSAAWRPTSISAWRITRTT
jgi:hypothetical protein